MTCLVLKVHRMLNETRIDPFRKEITQFPIWAKEINAAW